MRKLYVRSNCLGSKKAEDLLIAKSFNFKKINTSFQPLDEADLLDMGNLIPEGLKELINPNNATLKELGLNQSYQKMSKLELLNSIMNHPEIISYPIILQYNPNKKPKRLIIGFNPDEWFTKVYNDPNVTTYYNNLSANYIFDTCCYFDKVNQDDTETFVGAKK